ncbi:MAG: methyltransferase domain-containing protein [Planctomycetia bacterium]|nr:methyltransferase domain-containing protein [Planctomycetia bacterium]
MPLSALTTPTTDPTPIFEHFRGSYGSELLTAAVAHFNLFEHAAAQPSRPAELAAKLGLAARPAVVLFTALRAMNLLELDGAGRILPTVVAREHLMAGGSFYVGDYLGLAAEAPGVVGMVERLRTNRPYGVAPPCEPALPTASAGDGAAFIYREGMPSAMEQEASARHLTLALAGRAKNVAPAVAAQLNLDGAKILLDLGGGTGIYSIALVQKNPELKAIVFDRPEVLKVAAEMTAAYGVNERVELVPGDMFADPLPTGCDVVLLSNILHDWDLPECTTLLARAADALPPAEQGAGQGAGGRIVIHDVFLNDALDGPLPIALYSAALFTLTEGRAYSANEYRAMLRSIGFTAGEVEPTAIHCGLLTGTR